MDVDSINKAGGALEFTKQEYKGFLRDILKDNADLIYCISLKRDDAEIRNELDRFGIRTFLYEGGNQDLSVLCKGSVAKEKIKRLYQNITANLVFPTDLLPSINPVTAATSPAAIVAPPAAPGAPPVNIGIVPFYDRGAAIKNRRQTGGEPFYNEADDDGENDDDDDNDDDGYEDETSRSSREGELTDEMLAHRAMQSALDQQKSKYDVYFTNDPYYACSKASASSTIIIDVFRFCNTHYTVNGKKDKQQQQQKKNKEIMLKPELLRTGVSANVFSETFITACKDKTRIVVVAPTWCKCVPDTFIDFYCKQLKMQTPRTPNTTLKHVNDHTLLPDQPLTWLNLYLFAILVSEPGKVSTFVTKMIMCYKNLKGSQLADELSAVIARLDPDSILDYYINTSTEEQQSITDMSRPTRAVPNVVLDQALSMLSSWKILTMTS